MSIKTIIGNLLTEPDNHTHCPVRYIALLSGVAGIGLAIYDVVANKRPFDIQQFGIGSGSLMAGVGAALKLKPDTPNGDGNV